MSLCARSLRALATALGVLVITGMPVVTAEPIKFGTSQSLTGGLAPLGKAMLLTEQMWGEQVNARRGLLGRPIELVFYDDQSNPATDLASTQKSSMPITLISCLGTAPISSVRSCRSSYSAARPCWDVRARGE